VPRAKEEHDRGETYKKCKVRQEETKGSSSELSPERGGGPVKKSADEEEEWNMKQIDKPVQDSRMNNVTQHDSGDANPFIYVDPFNVPCRGGLLPGLPAK
jgi:hypothetical protein